MRVVMVGGGGASIVCANTLRALGSECSIDIYTRRQATAYTPCEHPFVLRGVLGFDDMFYASGPWFAKNRIALHTETEVEAILPAERAILVGGERVPYDALVLNTGSEPASPGVPGLEGERVHYRTTEMATARALDRRIAEGTRAAILGGGAIGLEVAETLLARGYRGVHLLTSAPHLLSRHLDSELCERVEEAARKAGVELHLGQEVTRAEARADGVSLQVAGGKSLDVDWVLVAKGVRPNVALARKAELRIGETGGIEVDPYLTTSDSNIYAVGDCCETWDPSSGRKSLSPLATFANRSGRLVGRNIHLGRTVRSMGSIPGFTAQVFGLTLAAVGQTEAAALASGSPVLALTRQLQTRRVVFGGQPVWVRAVADDQSQVLLGAQFVGPPEVSRMAERALVLIRERVTLGGISQMETLFSPPVSTPYDPLTQVCDIVIGKFLSRGDPLLE